MQSTDDAEQPAWATLPVPQPGLTPEPDSPHVPLPKFIQHNPNKKLNAAQHSYLRNWCKNHQRSPTPQDHEVMPQVASRSKPGEKCTPADVYKYCQTYWKGYVTRKKHEEAKERKNKKSAGVWATAKLLIPKLTEATHATLFGLHVEHPSPNPQLMEIFANHVALPIATVSEWFKLITALNAGEAPPAAPNTSATARHEEIDELDGNSHDEATRQPAAHLPTPTSDSFSPPPNIDPTSLRENLSIKTENLQSGPPSPVHSQTCLPTPVTCAPTPTTFPSMMASPSAPFSPRIPTEVNADGLRSIPSQLQRDDGRSMSPNKHGGAPLQVVHRVQAAVQSPQSASQPYNALREPQAGPPQTQLQVPAHYPPQQPFPPHRRVSYPLAQPNPQQQMLYRPYHHSPAQHSQPSSNYRQITFQSHPHPKAAVPPPALGCPKPVLNSGYSWCLCDPSKQPVLLGHVQVHPRAASNPDIRHTEPERPDLEIQLAQPRPIPNQNAHQPFIQQHQQVSTIPTPAQAQIHYHDASRPIASTSAHTLDMGPRVMSVPSQGPPRVSRENVGHHPVSSQSHRYPAPAAPPHDGHAQQPVQQHHQQPVQQHHQQPVQQHHQQPTVSNSSRQPSPRLGVTTESTSPIQLHNLSGRALGLFDAVWESVRRTEAGEFSVEETSALQRLDGVNMKAEWIMSDIGKKILMGHAAPPPSPPPPPESGKETAVKMELD